MIYTTKIKAIDPKDGKLKDWSGINVESISWGMAQQWLNENGYGYCEVDGVLIATIENGKRTDYDFNNN